MPDPGPHSAPHLSRLPFCGGGVNSKHFYRERNVSQEPVWLQILLFSGKFWLAETFSEYEDIQ